MLFNGLKFDDLFAMQHVKGAVVKNLNAEQTLFELALSVDCVFIRLFRDYLQVFIQDAITVKHAFVDVLWLLNKSMEFCLLFSLLVVHQELPCLVH